MPEGIRGEPLQLSKFHCQEMLYDFMSGRLDQERRQAVESGLKQHPELQKELDAIIAAAQFCEELSQIRPRPESTSHFESLRLRSEMMGEKLKYKNWPDMIKWSSEAVVISVFVAAVGWLVPWGAFRKAFENQQPQNEIVLADIDVKKTPPKSLSTSPDATIPPPVAAPIAAPVVAPVPAPAPVPTVTQTPQPTAAAAPAKVPAKVAQSVTPARQGLLYRMMMNVPQIKERAPALRDRIVALGAEKAGQVEIGHRQPKGNYFHFSMPENNYSTLLKTLGEYGPVRIYKGPHARVMPEGVIRIILTIEDGEGSASTNQQNESEAQSSEDSATEQPIDPSQEGDGE